MPDAPPIFSGRIARMPVYDVLIERFPSIGPLSAAVVPKDYLEFASAAVFARRGKRRPYDRAVADATASPRSVHVEDVERASKLIDQYSVAYFGRFTRVRRESKQGNQEN